MALKQLSLFDDIPIENIRIKDVAEQLGVSVSTVHNWIKTGHLTASSRDCVSKESLAAFQKTILGRTKLKSRANKSKKSEHDHEKLSLFITKKLSESTFDEHIVEEYEAALSESFRNKEGIYYTNKNIVDDMLRNSDITEQTTFLDPCCGCGNYIIGAIDKGVKVENVFGYDTDANAIEITKKRIYEKTGIIAENIICADFLDIAKTIDRKFDLIYTNPPWGKKIPKGEKISLGNFYECGESTDTCSLFAFASMRLLSPNGSLGFLFPEAVLNIATFQSLRRLLLSYDIQEIKNYGRPFENVQTSAYSIILKNQKPSKDHIIRCVEKEDERFRKQSSFLNNPKQIFNTWANQSEQDVIDKLMEIPHCSLKDNAVWGLGIVTGDNKNKCRTIPEANDIPVYRGKDITKSGLLKPSLYISSDLSQCQQVAPLQIYKAKEKIIYRFICDKIICYCDKKQRFVLNSANIVVPQKTLPVNCSKIVSLLNSDIMNWLFAKIYNTHKVLRGDLETLPIYLSGFQHDTFNEQSFLTTNNIEYNNGTFRIKG